MERVTATANTFHCFQDLPPELRQGIWILTFQQYEKPASLFMYKPDLFGLRPIVNIHSDQGWSYTNYVLRAHLLDPIHIKISPAYVNYEAHKTLVDYAGKKWNNPDFKVVASNTLPFEELFERSFHDDRDILFVPTEIWDNFLRELLQEEEEEDIGQSDAFHNKPGVQHFAIPVEALQPSNKMISFLNYLV